MGDSFDCYLRDAIALWEDKRGVAFRYVPPLTSLSATMISMIVELRKELNELKERTNAN